MAEAEPEMAPEDETNEVVVTLGDTVTATTTEQAPAADTKTTAPAADSTKETAADTESTEQKQITYVALGDASWQAWAWPMSSTVPTALPLTAWTCAPISRATPQTAMSVR